MNNNFSDIELHVMHLLAEGMNAYEICDWLNIDYKQYVKYKNNVLKKLGIKKITQILATAINREMIDF